MHPQTQTIQPRDFAATHHSHGNATRGADRPSRSRQFIQLLRQEFVYSEKRARDIIFQETEAVLRESAAPVIVSRLSREAARRGRATGQQIGFDLENWETAAKATMNAMLAAGALLGKDGRAIPFTIAAQATEVADVAPCLCDLTEAHLLGLLVRRAGDVTSRDHTSLAHALFRQFDPSVPMADMEDRVAHLFASLAHRIGMTESGVYYLLDLNR